MSKLEKLINKLCPNGVEYKELNTLVDYIQPTKYIVKSTKYNAEYDIPVLTPGQTFILGYTNEKEGIYNANKENPIILFDDFTTAFRWINFKFKLKSSAVKILIPKNNNINFRYVFYTMQTIKFDNTQHNRQWISKYSILKIPVPPIEVQNEIVRILDNFTDLEAELEAELEARIKQYEYYENKLFEFDTNNIKYKRVDFEKIAYFSQGLQVDVKEQYFEPFENSIQFLRIVDFVNDRELPRYIKRPDEKYIKNENELIMIRYGASAAGKVFINKKGAIANNMFKINLTSKEIDVNYLKYFLSQEKNYNLLNSSSGKSTMPAINFRFLGKLKIDYPSLDEQRRIVKILDRFDKICNDISEGLPAEIEARRKQYEYYRDKLLNFKELKVENKE